MKRIRFNIASLLVVVLFVAVGFAGLREASEIWESGSPFFGPPHKGDCLEHPNVKFAYVTLFADEFSSGRRLR